MAQRSSLSGRSPFCQLVEVKKGSSVMMISTSSAFKQQKLEETRDKPRERKKDSLTEGVKSNSIVENLLVPSDQETYWRANWQETEITHVRWYSQVLLCLDDEF